MGRFRRATATAWGNQPDAGGRLSAVAGKTAERRDEREGHAVAFVVGALLGGAAGAAWTLFNAPRSGAETRAAIVQTVVAVVDQVRETVRAAGERVADRLALTFDAFAGGEGADRPASLGGEPAVVTAGPGSGAAATAASPTVAANGQAAASAVPAAVATAADETALALDPSEVEQPAGAAPAGTTS
jgi:gas vesicle protein